MMFVILFGHGCAIGPHRIECLYNYVYNYIFIMFTHLQ